MKKLFIGLLLAALATVLVEDVYAQRAMIAYYDSGAPETPRYRTWDGSSWSSQGSALNVGGTIQWMVLKAAPNRNEYILATLDANGHVNAQAWQNGAWIGIVELTTGIGTDYDVFRGFDIAYEQVSGDAIIVYSDGTPTPKYRVWDGSTLSPEGSVASIGSGIPIWISLESNPNSDEIILVTIDDDTSAAETYAQVWDGNSWGNVQLLETDTARNPGSPFGDRSEEVAAIAYEHTSGRAVVVWGVEGSGTPQYRIWSGSSWLSEGNTNAVGAEPRWVRLATEPGSNRVLMATLDSAADVNVQTWTGSAWGTNFQVTGGAETDDRRTFDVAFENSTGIGMISYGESNDRPRYRTCTGSGCNTGSWSAESSALEADAGAGDPEWIILVPDPNSNDIMLAHADDDGTPDIGVQRWTGSWGDGLAVETSSRYDFEAFSLAYKWDITPPTVTFVPPTDANNTVLTTRNWTYINVTATDGRSSIESALLEWNNVNETMIKVGSGKSAVFYINKTDLADGTYTYRVWVNDSSQNWGVSEMRVITIDTTPPTITFVPPTPNNEVTNDTFAYINVTSDEGLNQSLLEWSGANESMQGSGQNWFLNKTNLPNGNYTFRVWGEDYAGNWNVTEERWVYINASEDLVPPLLEFVPPTPDNASFVSATSVTINVSHVEDNPDTLVLNWNGVNETYSYSGSSTAITKTVTEGTYTYYVWANDTLGYSSQTETRTFTVDTTPPTIDYAAPTPADGASLSVTQVTINVTHTETYPDTLVLSWNGVNETYPYSGTSTAITKTVTTGTYTYYVWVNDSAGNSAQTATRTLNIDITPPLWRNQGQNTSYVEEGGDILLYAQGYDASGLDFAVLETNESGAWGGLLCPTFSSWTIGSGGDPWGTSATLINVTEDEGDHYLKIGGFADNFDDGDEAWTEVTGTWSVVGGEYQQTDTATSRHVSIVGDVMTDYEAHANISGLTTDFRGGLIFRYVDIDNYYIARVADNNDQIEIAKISGGAFSILDSAAFVPSTGVFYKVAIKTTGDFHEAWFYRPDGSLIGYLSAADSDHAQGRIGLYSYGGSNAYDDIRVYNSTTARVTSIPQDAESVGNSGDIWKRIKFEGSLPTGTSVDLYFEASWDNTTFDSVLVKTGASPGVFYDIPAKYQRRYGKIRVELTTGDIKVTPVVQSLTLQGADATCVGRVMDMGDATTWTWSNFTWSNASVPENTTVAWRIWYNDTYGLWNVTDVMTFKVQPPDVTPPTVEYVSPTPPPGVNASSKVTQVNITVTHNESNPDTLILNWNGANETYTYSGAKTTITKTVAPGNTYTYYVWLNDTYGNTNQAPTRNFTVQENLIGEVGTAVINDTWSLIQLRNYYANPVIIASPISHNEDESGETRIRNANNTAFQAMVQEPATGSTAGHLNEDITYLVIDQGNYTLGDGTIIEAYNVNVTETVWSSDSTAWKTINYVSAFTTTPVVLSQVITYYDTDWVTTAQRNVGTTSFQLALETAQDGTGDHGEETVSYIAWENTKGKIVKEDGFIAFDAVITTDSIRGHDNGCYAYPHSLGQTPQGWVAQQQTRDGSNGGWVRYCSDDSTMDSTNTYWEIEEVDNGERSHTDEVVGFIVFNDTGDMYFRDIIPPTVEFVSPTPPSGVNATEAVTQVNITVTHNELNPDTLILNWNGANETYTYSGAKTTITKTVAPGNTYTYYVWLNDTYGNTNQAPTRNFTVQENLIGEVGTAVINDTWSLIQLRNYYANPVIIASPISHNEDESGETRIRNANNTAFQAMVQEPATGSTAGHLNEDITYLVIDQGNYTLGDGTIIEAYNVNVTETVWSSDSTAWKTINYVSAFTTTPVVLSQVITYYDTDWVTTAQRNVGTTSFQLALETAQDGTGDHGEETVSYIAWENTKGKIVKEDGFIAFDAVITTDSIRGHDNGCYAYPHSLGQTPQGWVAQQQTRDGSNGGWVRYCSDDSTMDSTNTYWEIEEVDNGERSHTDEVVGFIVFNDMGDIMMRDRFPPRWRNQGQNLSYGLLQEGASAKMYAQGWDGFGLDFAWLETNESGVFENKSGVYGSPMDLNDARRTWVWSNFTWNNASVTPKTQVWWRIWYNDTSGNVNVTDYMNFTIISWRSYLDPDHTMPSNIFTPYDAVYMHGQGYAPSTPYDIAYYNNTDELVNTSLGVYSLVDGNLSDMLNLSDIPGANETWHSVVYPSGASIPATYTPGDANILARHAFNVTASILSIETYSDETYTTVKDTYQIGETIFIMVRVRGTVAPQENYLFDEGRSDPLGNNTQEFRNQLAAPPVSGQDYTDNYTLIASDPLGTWRIWAYTANAPNKIYSDGISTAYKDITVIQAPEFPLGAALAMGPSVISYLLLRRRRVT
jgi:hypothetical protein